MERNIDFSFLLPTRGRPEDLEMFLNSLQNCTTRPERVECVLVLDDDDDLMRDFDFQGLKLVKKTVAGGLNMGKLNQAAYHASSGSYLFIMNDDVEVKTKGWDVRVMEELSRYPDGIVLMHVNDLIFRDRLCTFPLVSRKFCELVGGICPDDYWRHRIDDHIYNIFNMVSYLGYRRTIYLPDVVFEHHHYVKDENGKRVYKLDGDIHEPDINLFEELFDSRKEAACRLVEYIEGFRRERLSESRMSRLNELPDSFCIRNRNYIHIHPGNKKRRMGKDRVTIGVVSANFKSPMAMKCLDLIKENTSDYELIILDNNKHKDFNHAADMNRIMEICCTEYLVLMDDDVFVESGWLEGLFQAMTENTGVVTPAHKDQDGDFSYAGIVFSPDRSGNHGHSFEQHDAPVPITTMSSALLLIDMERCGHLRFQESMAKYFLDLDFGLQVWEEGVRLMLAPSVPVTHIGGGTIVFGSAGNHELWDKHRRIFEHKWFETGRLNRLMSDLESTEPRVVQEWTLLSDVNDLFAQQPDEDRVAYMRRAQRVFSCMDNRPVLHQFIVNSVWARVRDEGLAHAHDDGKWPLAYLSSLYGRQIPTGRCEGYRTCFYKDQYWAFPEEYGKRFIRSLVRQGVNSLLNADTLDELHVLISQKPSPAVTREKKSPQTEEPTLLDTYRDVPIFRYYGAFVAARGLNREDLTEGNQTAKEAIKEHTLPQVCRGIDMMFNASSAEKQEVLLCTLPPEKMRMFLDQVPPETPLVYLASDVSSYIDHPGGGLMLEMKKDEYPDFCQDRLTDQCVRELRSRGYGATIVPSLFPDTWRNNHPERFGYWLCEHVALLSAEGNRSDFIGERAHRLEYNKAYLSQALSHVDISSLQSSVELGCSDGLACEMLSNLGVPSVYGVDSCGIIDVVNSSRGVDLSRGNALDLPFPDNSFDFSFSIAVMEHVTEPLLLLEEMLRVTRPGGYCYINTAPLFYSPFGHHIPYFSEPWMHLTHSRDELMEAAKQDGIDKRVWEDVRITIEDYIDGMLSPSSLNGFALSEFQFEEFLKRNDVQEIFFEKTYEGRNLLPEKMRSRLWQYSFGELTEHGVNMMFRKTRDAS